jgi:hypothetical protein
MPLEDVENVKDIVSTPADWGLWAEDVETLYNIVDI